MFQNFVQKNKRCSEFRKTRKNLYFKVVKDDYKLRISTTNSSN